MYVFSIGKMNFRSMDIEFKSLGLIIIHTLPIYSSTENAQYLLQTSKLFDNFSKVPNLYVFTKNGLFYYLATVVIFNCQKFCLIKNFSIFSDSNFASFIELFSSDSQRKLYLNPFKKCFFFIFSPFVFK